MKKVIPRIFQNSTITVGSLLTLDSAASFRFSRSQPLEFGNQVILFNGNGKGYIAEIVPSDCSQRIRLNVLEEMEDTNKKRNFLQLNVGLGLSQTSIFQKLLFRLVELGVKSITPLYFQNSVVKSIPLERLTSKYNRFQKLIENACEISGRLILPVLSPSCHSLHFINSLNSFNSHGLYYDLQSTTTLSSLSLTSTKSEDLNITLLIPSEKDLSTEEKKQCKESGWQSFCFGQSFLSHNTQCISVIAALQVLYGEFR